MPASTRTAQALLNSYHGKTSNFGALGSVPAHYWLALSSTNPGATGAGATEPSGGAYARVTTAAADWTAASNANPSVSSNANAITFPAPSGADWLSGASIGYFMRFDASTSGNMLDYGVLTAPITALDGGPAPSFPVGALIVQIPST